MTDDLVLPISERPAPASAPSGRKADLIAMTLASLGALLAISAAIWFFLGFAENDKRVEHLTSAFVLTLALFAFAVGPFALVAVFAKRAYKTGATRADLLWTLFLMLPWLGLGTIAATHTPLPLWYGVLIAVLAALLTLWALVSYCIDWIPSPKTRTAEPTDTAPSQENEVSGS